MTRVLRAGLLAAVLAGGLVSGAIPASAQPQEPIDPVVPRDRPDRTPGFVGAWAADPTWCANDPASTDQLPVTISADSFGGLENTCPFADVLALGVGRAWRVVMQCTGEGVTTTEAEVFLLTDAGRLARYTSEGFLIEMTRCAP